MNFRIASLLVLTAGFLAPSTILACERCASQSQGCCCKSDDAGLLKFVDSLLGGIHSKGRKSCDHGPSCDHEPGCGVEPARIAEPSCGAEPTCGVEIVATPEPTCGCETRPDPSSGCSMHSAPSVQSYASPYHSPQHQYHAAPAPSHQPTSEPPRPIPAPRTPKTLPDTMVDPFQDEGAPPRIQAKPINFRREAPRRPAGTYGVQFNDQAMFRYRIPAGSTTREVIPASQVAPAPERQADGAVVRASATQPARLSSSPAVKRLPAQPSVQWPNAKQQPASNPVRATGSPAAHADYYHNPLR